jgi:hypothetical protein
MCSPEGKVGSIDDQVWGMPPSVETPRPSRPRRARTPGRNRKGRIWKVAVTGVGVGVGVALYAVVSQGPSPKTYPHMLSMQDLPAGTQVTLHSPAASAFYAGCLRSVELLQAHARLESFLEPTHADIVEWLAPSRRPIHLVSEVSADLRECVHFAAVEDGRLRVGGPTIRGILNLTPTPDGEYQAFLSLTTTNRGFDLAVFHSRRYVALLVYGNVPGFPSTKGLNSVYRDALRASE